MGRKSEINDNIEDAKKIDFVQQIVKNWLFMNESGNFLILRYVWIFVEFAWSQNSRIQFFLRQY